MRVTDDRYRLLVEHMTDAVFEATTDGVITWISPSVERLSGWRPEEVVGRNVVDFVAPEQLDAVDHLKDLAAKGEAIAFIGQSRCADGTFCWVSVSSAPLEEVEGTVVHSVGVVRDVDEMVRARLALAASEEHYRLLADNVADVVIRLEPDLTVTWVSPSIRFVLGYEPEQLVGRNGSEFVEPGDWDSLPDPRDDVAAGARPDGPEQRMYIRVRHSDGSWRWMSGRPVLITDAAGTLTNIVIGWSDVTELIEAREEADEAHDRLRATLDTLMDPHVIISPIREHGQIVDFAIVEANEAVANFYERSRADLVGCRTLDLMTAEAIRIVFPLHVKVAETGVPLVLDDFPFEVNGVERRYDLRAVKVGDDVSHTWRDVTHRHDVEAHLSHLATHDTLTGLANRGALIDELSRALIAARRSGQPVAVIMLDLDHFKNVNDTLGHAMGDQLLKAAARRLEAGVRGGDLVARLGGDEFVIVMRDTIDGREALSAADRIVEAFRQPITAGGLELVATTSVGVVIAPSDASVESALREADAAMYRAKRAGRDQMAIFNDDLREAEQERSRLESQLRPALSLGELALHYQPEVDLTTGRVCAVEALLRWNHPSGELYPASRFIDLAEDIGVIIDSTNWAIHEACSAARRWDELHPDLHLRLRLNLSRQQLADPTLVDSFDHAIGLTGIDPTSIVVDIGEDMFIDGSTNVPLTLAELSDRGIGIALDNFLTGFGAIGYLSHRTLRTVRLDRSFLGSTSSPERGERLVAGLVAFAQHLDLVVAADGVETLDQARRVKHLGCATAQGYLFAPPMAADELTEQLDRTFPL